MPQCSARSKRTGQQCQRQAMEGRTVCYHHGGKTPVGLAAPNYQTGRYSRYLPARLLERYHEAASDPQLLELQAEIALIDARLGELLGRVDTGESGRRWRRAQAAAADYRAALKRGEDVDAARDALFAAILAGVQDEAAWADIHATIEQRRKLAESERKRLVETNQTITVERAMLIIAGLTDIIRRHVPDPQQRAAIAADLSQLTGPAPGRRDRGTG
jgi:hypothetical protein